MSKVDQTKLAGKTKAAILMVAMGSSASSRVLKEMSDEEIEVVTKEIAQLENIPGDTIDRIKSEFRNLVMGQQYASVGGIEYARELLENTMGSSKSLDVMKKVQRSMEIRGFNVLKNLDTEQLLNLMQK